MASLSTKEAKRQQEINERRLLAIVKKPGNTTCCDCGASGPRWASFNIGCFLCIRCGGIHRRMGTHISKVKSISLDAWKSEQIDHMEAWGNDKVNELYLYNAKSRSIPSDDDGMEQYIRDKYERKRFFKPGGVAGKSEKTTNSDERALSIAVKALYDMGFKDVSQTREALKKTNNNIPAAIELMVSSSSTNKHAAELDQLRAMGFENDTLSLRALEKVNFNVERAVEILIQSPPELPKKDTPPKASQLLGISNDDKKDGKKEDLDLFGDFEGADISKRNETTKKDEFGDFKFLAEVKPNAVSEPPKKNDKDYIMSLFNNIPNQTQNNFNMNHNPQFNIVSNTMSSNGGLSGLNFNQANLSNQFAGLSLNNSNSIPLNTSLNSNTGFNSFNQPLGFQSPPNNLSFNNTSSFNSFASNPTQSNNDFGSFTTAQPQTQASEYLFSAGDSNLFSTPQQTKPTTQGLNKAFEGLDPFKNLQVQNSIKSPQNNNNSNGNTVNNANSNNSKSKVSDDLLDLLG